jgi:hypothetical protein
LYRVTRKSHGRIRSTEGSKLSCREASAPSERGSRFSVFANAIRAFRASNRECDADDRELLTAMSVRTMGISKRTIRKSALPAWGSTCDDGHWKTRAFDRAWYIWDPVCRAIDRKLLVRDRKKDAGGSHRDARDRAPHFSMSAPYIADRKSALVDPQCAAIGRKSRMDGSTRATGNPARHFSMSQRVAHNPPRAAWGSALRAHTSRHEVANGFARLSKCAPS